MRGVKRQKPEPLVGEENICLLTKGVTLHGKFYPAGTRLSCGRHDALQLAKSRSAEIVEMKWPNGRGLEYGAPVVNDFGEFNES